MVRHLSVWFVVACAAGSVAAQAPPWNVVPPISPVAAQAPPVDVASPTAPAVNRLEDLLKPSFRVRGLIETEAALTSQSADSKAIIGNIQNGYGFRRIRLGAQGTVGDATRWVSEVELAGGNVQILDVFVGITAIPSVRELRIGHFREPFSLEGMTGVPFVTFMERSPLNPLDPARSWGVCGYWWPDDERTVFAVGAFKDGTSLSGNTVSDDRAWAYTARLTGLPIYDNDENAFRLLHVGAAISHRNPSDGAVIFNPGRAPSLLAVVDNPDSPFLPAVTIPANAQQLFNLQSAWVNGSFSVQGEWFASNIQRSDVSGSVFLHGFYLQASQFLTGEHRGYDRTRGAFSTVNVKRPLTRSRDVPGAGLGAVELAARYSFYNFSSGNLPPSTDGASSRALLNQMELGVNWYLNDFTRFMFNYTLPFVDKIDVGSTSAHVFSIRAAVHW